MGKDLLSLAGEHNAVSCALEQFAFQCLFQLTDTSAHRRNINTQPIGYRRKMLLTGQFEKDSDIGPVKHGVASSFE